MYQRNKYLTFFFAFIPGAGQMYQGYMKRGLTHISLFCGVILLAIVTQGLCAVVLPIIWMYSFFDCFNLRGQLLDDDAPADAFPFNLGSLDELHLSASHRSRLLGWGLILLGAFVFFYLYLPTIGWVLRDLGLSFLADLLWDLPSLLVAVALILTGRRLVKGPQAKAPAPQDYPDYAEESETKEDGHGND